MIQSTSAVSSRSAVSAALASALMAVLLLPATGCAGGGTAPDVASIYRRAAEESVETRRPVILVPGILGSKLVDEGGQEVWGAFTRRAVDPDFPAGARTFSLPMSEGAALSDLKDSVVAHSVLDVLIADIGPFRNVDFAAYLGVLRALDIGGYRDRSLAKSGAVDYGSDHYTCYQFPYDWRRDISESAAELGSFVGDAQASVRAARGLGEHEPVRVDVVAHSMGGLVLRYYLRYGQQPLPTDGSLPKLTWEGAKNVENAVLVGTPNAGSVESLGELVDGLNLHPLFPNYRPSVLGTMPSIYQLMPRPRHSRITDSHGTVVDHFDPATWEQYGWGLASKEPDRALAWLLDDVEPGDRRRVAMEHLTKCLAKAKQFHRALDVEASPPEGTRLILFAGDAEETQARYEVEDEGHLRCVEVGPGDGTVTRASALMDERLGRPYAPGLQSPIDWHRVQFIFEDHVSLTSSREFTDNMLHILLEEPGHTEAMKSGESHAGANARPVHWSYQGASGPSNWGQLCEDYGQCAHGTQQSPINIASNRASSALVWEVEYLPTSLNVSHHQHVSKLIDNGHTIQATVDPGSWLEADHERFELMQFHFHTPSEHSLDGEHFPMEAHFVHQSEAGALLVLGVFVALGEHNAAFDPLIASLPNAPGETSVAHAAEIDIAALLPSTRSCFEYSGSLTTPPCSEGVKWLVVKDPVELSANQLLEFARRVGTNNRPVQPLNGRQVGTFTEARQPRTTGG